MPVTSPACVLSSDSQQPVSPDSAPMRPHATATLCVSWCANFNCTASIRGQVVRVLVDDSHWQCVAQLLLIAKENHACTLVHTVTIQAGVRMALAAVF